MNYSELLQAGVEEGILAVEAAMPSRLVPSRLVPSRLVPSRLVPSRLVPSRLVPLLATAHKRTTPSTPISARA